jgi:hypothetical protein
MKDNDSAFPVFEEAKTHADGSACTDYMLTSPDMTLRQYAAIKLRVPRSGDPELDKWIKESRRADLAEAAMSIIVGKAIPWPDSRLENDWKEQMSQESYGIADAMLAEWEKTGTKEKVSDRDDSDDFANWEKG